MTDSAVVEPVAAGDLGSDPGPGPRITSGEILAVRATAGAVGGFLLALAFPSTGWWPLAPVAVAVIALAVRAAGPSAGALIGLVSGLGFFVPHLQWTGIYVGALPWLALAFLEAAFFAVLGMAMTWAWRAPGSVVGMPVAIAGLWVLQEAARSRLPFEGFPWGRLAFSQSEAPTAGLAALGGAPLVSAAVAAAGGLLAWAVAALLTYPDRRRAVRAALGAVLAAVALVAVGVAVPRPTDAPRTAQVAAVQGNVPRAGLNFNAERRAVLDNHANATLALARQVAAGGTRPDLVVWPENASDIDPLRNPDAAAVIDEAVAAIGVPTMVGTVLREPADRLSNATLVWTPGRGPGERYVKQHPAPFGEYIPLRGFFRVFSDKVDLVRRDFVAGDRIGLLQVGPARAADVICFEVAYDSLVRDPVRAGADLVVVQTNNATFGRTDESVQQLAMSRLRAIESGRSVVHISTVGISALIAPDGQLMQRSGHFRQEVLAARLPLRVEQTVATRVGAAPEWVLATVGLILTVAGLWTARTARTGRDRPATGTPERTTRR